MHQAFHSLFKLNEGAKVRYTHNLPDHPGPRPIFIGNQRPGIRGQLLYPETEAFALGVKIDMGPQEVAQCIDEVGMGFMLASVHHPASGRVAGVRRALGVRTVFNLLGPLTNPAGVRRQLLGVSTLRHLRLLADALACTGCEHALVVCGDLGMDELSVTGSNEVVEVTQGVVSRPFRLEPEECGLCHHPLADLAGGGPAMNAAITREVLAGRAGGPRDATLLNAAAAIYVAGAASSVIEGVSLARASIDSGRALHVLERLVEVTNGGSSNNAVPAA
jgi:anthranilate phosphoribosyltransferase